VENITGPLKVVCWLFLAVGRLHSFNSCIFPNFKIEMNRNLWHICFWAAYLVQDTLLAFLWEGSRLHALPVAERLLMAFQLCAALLPPKFLFTYLLLYVFLDRILKPYKKSLYIFMLVITVVATLFSVRSIEAFFVYPVIYHLASNTRPYFHAFSFLFSFIDLGYVSVFAVAIHQIRLQFADKEREKALIKEKLETELKYLRNQTNPHFLFNTLNNIYGLARRKSDDTAEVVMKLSKLLRFMLYESNKPTVKIGEEIKMLDDFINLEKIRYAKKLELSFNKKIDDESEQIAPLLLLPFVENAFKHGASENRFESFIHIALELEGGVLHFYIENAKEDNNDANEKGNIGLANVRRQLELMYKQYDLRVVNELSVFKVFLTVNLRSHAHV
jgi:two-component system, LytTR family, sensor kinase